MKGQNERLITAKLVGSNCCPICGLAFKATPPLRPITQSEREIFYGGRVSFFKEVECRCTAKYDLCIEKKYDSVKEEEKLKVIDMIILKEGIPLDELKRQEQEERLAQADEAVVQAVAEAVENSDRFVHLAERQEIRKQTILATVLDKDEKIKTLTAFTVKELQTMCKRRKLKFNKRDNKTQLAETLLAYDPTMVVANPEEG